MNDYACIDCVMLIANGETPPEMTEEETDSFIKSVEKNTEGFHVFLGDDEREFSMSRCDVCHSRLAGYRHEVIFVERKG